MIPAPLGMIVAGIILRNVHDGHIISGLRSSWTREFRGIALAVIFLRSGLELDLGVRDPLSCLLAHSPSCSSVTHYQFHACLQLAMEPFCIDAFL